MLNNLHRGAVVGALLLASALSAQTTASYRVYGPHDCIGSGKGAANCLNINSGGGTNSTQRLTNEYCYGFVAPSNLTVIGVELFTKPFTSGSQTGGVAFYFGTTTNGTAPKTTRSALGELSVGTTQGWYAGYFSTPIKVTSGHSFWIGQGNSNGYAAAGITTGSVPSRLTYWRRPPLGTTAWSPTGIVKHPAVRVLCLTNSTRTAPVILTHTGVPKLGNSTFGLQVRQAPAGFPVTLLLGLSRLNLDLTVIGAPKCFMLCKDDIYLALGSANSTGVASVVLPVPKTGLPLGLKFYNQAYVLDPLATGRPLKITVSNGGEGVIGN